jgi:hypothetical protein
MGATDYYLLCRGSSRICLSSGFDFDTPFLDPWLKSSGVHLSKEEGYQHATK